LKIGKGGKGIGTFAFPETFIIPKTLISPIGLSNVRARK
jgi:hypothetical protein